MRPIGSLQLRRYRVLRRGGVTMSTACATAGLAIGEARLTEAEDMKYPPDPACFVLPDDDPCLAMITPAGSSAEDSQIGEVSADAQEGERAVPSASTAPVKSSSATPSTKEGTTMAKASTKKKTPTNGELMKPDFERARSIHRADIVPANKTQRGAMQEASTAWKAIKKDCHVNTPGFRVAAKIADMEEVEQQAFLRSLRGGLDAFGIVLHRDLVDEAGGGDGQNDMDVVPLGEAPETKLPELTD